jgi:ankyrin repeat protein
MCSGLTAYHLAASNNHSFCLKELKKKKEGMLDVTCNAGWTPLHYAVRIPKQPA